MNVLPETRRRETAGSPRPAPTPRRRRRGRTTRQVVGGAIVAAGVVAVVHSAFGITNPIVAVLLAYLAFIGIVALVEYASASDRTRAVIDLTSAERVEHDEPVTALLVSVPEPVSRDVPLKRRSVTGADITEFGVAVIGAVAFAEVLRIVLHMRSIVGFVVWTYVAFVVLYFVLARDRNDPEIALDRVVTVIAWSVGLAVAALLGWMIVYVVVKGLPKLSWDYLTEDLSKVGPLTPGGGAKHAIIGTIEQVGLATMVVVPVGILTAVYLHEVQGRIARPVRFITDAMSGLPSIVAGLLIFTIWVIGHGFSGAAGAAALAILMLPTMTRASEEILRTVPDQLREGALALGAPQWRVVHRVVLPTVSTGLVTASLLAVARAIGETAPLLMTAFGNDAVNWNPFHGPQSALPLFVFKLIFTPNQTQIQRAWTGALVLIMLVFVLFVSARVIAGRGRRKLGGVQG